LASNAGARRSLLCSFDAGRRHISKATSGEQSNER
jgi:hypothetical protein